MDRQKVAMVVKGYLLKDKKNTIITSLFLCCITMFLLIGNQLFLNLGLANKMNAQSLEGKQHVTYYSIGEDEFQKIKKCPFVKEAGQSFSLGQAEDGTAFAYIDEVFRNLGATVADKNVKQVISGHWAEKEDEVVFTENYMKKYNLKLGDRVCTSLVATDADTGDFLFKINKLQLVVAGVIEDQTGFLDRRSGYVSKKLADSVITKNSVMVNVVARFKSEKDIPGSIDRLNKYLGYDKEKLETVIVRQNMMLSEAVSDDGNLKKQNRAMNFIVWLVCAMVVYNIFYSRFFTKKRDFSNLRKIGFNAADLLKITGTEFLILAFTGFVTGIVAGFLLNKIIYVEIMKPFISHYEAGAFVTSGMSFHSIKNTAAMIVMVLILGIITAVLQLRMAAPVNVMKNRRKNIRKIVLALMILSLSAILTSWISVQDNKSESGIIYVHAFVPGDLQVETGSITEGILEGTVSAIPDSALDKVKEIKGIKQIQSYEIDYDTDIFLCEEKSKLNKDAPGYKLVTGMDMEIDGRKQCLFNMIFAATDNIKALVPDYNESKDEHAAVMKEEIAQALNLKPGDTFTIYGKQIAGADSKKNVPGVTLKLIGTTQEMTLSEKHEGANLLIVDRETARLFPGRLSRQIINIWTEDEKETDVMSGLNQIEELDGCFLHNARQQMHEYTDSDRNQTALQYFFIALLALIGILTYFNTVFTNTLSRINELSIMHKIGIGNTEMYKMVTKEGMKNGIATLTATGIAQSILCINMHIRFGTIFFAIDICIFISCMLFPAIVLLYILKFK